MRLHNWQISQGLGSNVNVEESDVKSKRFCPFLQLLSRLGLIEIGYGSRIPASVSMGSTSFPSVPPARSIAGTTEANLSARACVAALAAASSSDICRSDSLCRWVSIRTLVPTWPGHLLIARPHRHPPPQRRLWPIPLEVAQFGQHLRRFFAEVLLFVLGPCNLLDQLDTFQRRDLILDSGELVVPLSDSLAFTLRASICCWMSSAGPACPASARVWRASSNDSTVSWTPLFSEVP